MYVMHTQIRAFHSCCLNVEVRNIICWAVGSSVMPYDYSAVDVVLNGLIWWQETNVRELLEELDDGEAGTSDMV